MTTQRAVLAGGCFWGMQDLIRKKPGVISTRVGYSGGDVPNATYRNHGTHAEAIEIIFDPAKWSYRDLLEFFFLLLIGIYHSLEHGRNLLGAYLVRFARFRNFNDLTECDSAPHRMVIADQVICQPLL